MSAQERAGWRDEEMGVAIAAGQAISARQAIATGENEHLGAEGHVLATPGEPLRAHSEAGVDRMSRAQEI